MSNIPFARVHVARDDSSVQVQIIGIPDTSPIHEVDPLLQLPPRSPSPLLTTSGTTSEVKPFATFTTFLRHVPSCLHSCPLSVADRRARFFPEIASATWYRNMATSILQHGNESWQRAEHSCCFGFRMTLVRSQPFSRLTKDSDCSFCRCLRLAR
jgi:hypothetical protein